jgi:hypothetical protein
MELEHSFTVPVPADQAWDVLLDVERVAPCMPGATLDTIRSDLHDQVGQTEVTVHTSLNVTGRPAQFGRGMMADVSAKLIGVFASNLADMLATGNGSAPEPAVPGPAVQATAHAGPVPTATTAASAAPATSSVPGDDSLNLLQVAGLPVLKRIAAPAAALLAVLAGVLIWRRRTRQ